MLSTLNIMSKNNNIKEIVEDLDCNENIITKSSSLTWTWQDVVWPRVAKLIFMHLHFPYGLYLFLFVCSGKTAWFTYFYALAGGIGLGAGNHRFWSHRAFKANLPYKVLITLMALSSYQNDVIWWCLIHRLHHKYTDSDGDPHNSRRGFFFSHFGWFLIKDQPEVMKNRKNIDMTDLEQDPVLKFQQKYYHLLTILLVILVPILIPMIFWGESFWIAINVCVIFKYTIQLHCSVTVNSLAHLYGTKPYDKSFKARENKVAAFLTAGEGWHNYHHSFPYDYRASEHGFFEQWNFSKIFIELFAWIGWVTDLRTANSDIVTKRRQRTGSFSCNNHLAEKEITFF